MSRRLPSRPNLEHLRKQAKDLLAELRPAHPQWQLADAQHALARGYGFDSWPKLKAHVSAASGAPGEAASPLAGTWIANLERSQPHPANPFRGATLVVTVSGPRVTLAQTFVDASGQTMAGRMAIDADGEARPSRDAGDGHLLVARWLDRRVLEVVDLKDGQVAGRGTYEVSPDGATMTVATGEQRLVFDRAAG